MSEKLEVVRGSGNVFRDLGHKNADVEQLKAILAAEIIKALDREGLSMRGAHRCTGIAVADFSRIRNANLGRFTVDRLISIVNRLGSRVDVNPRFIARIEKSRAGYRANGGVSLDQVRRRYGLRPKAGGVRATRPSRRSTKRR
jgi:predicted XRE-type DNA-binding protein